MNRRPPPPDFRASEEGSSLLAAGGDRLALRVLDNLFAFVGLLDVDGTLLDANAESLLQAGLVLRDVQGLKFWDCYWWNHDAAVQQELRRACERAAAGEIVRYEPVVRMASDSRMTIDFQVAPLYDEVGVMTHLVASGVDITERKQAEEELRRSEELVRTIAENSTQGFAMMDARGYCTYANRAWLEMTGYSREEIGAAPLHDLVHHHYPDGRPFPMHECPIDRALPEHFDVRAHEDLFFRKDGTPFPVMCAASPIFKDGRPVSTVIEIRDMTAARAAEAAQRESEAQFAALADNIAQLAWMTDASGAIHWLNRRWFEYTGTTLEEMRGWGWRAVHHPDHLQRVEAKFRRHVASGDPWEDTFPLRRHDGQYRWFLSRAFPLRDRSGRIVRWFGTNTDVHEQREAQEALREADRRKDEFISVLAHELRNPLAPVRNAVEILQRSPVPDERVRRMHEVIGRQVGHMARLIDDLLDVARIARGQMQLRTQECDLARLARDTAEDWRDALQEQGSTLEVVDESGALWVRGDPVRLRQMVANYLQNAVRFGKGGRVTVRTARDGRHALVSVTDSGVGIAPELLPRLFTVFAQADQGLARTGGGLGLGLALTRGLAELHGGSVAAHSRGVGAGATFELRIPLLARAALAGDPDAPQRQSGGLHILLVEDNADASETLRMLLEGVGHTVTATGDGPAALRAIAQQVPDAIVCDIGLPGMSGYELAAAVRARLGAAPLLIALSGYAQDDARRQAADAGFDRHLAKPVEFPALLQALQGVGGR